MVKIDRITNMIEQPDVWLCHRNYDKICKLSYIDDLKIYVTANAVDEVAFSLHKYNNGVEFEYWEQLKDLKIVLVDGFGYFEIAVDKQVSDDTKKVITGISTEAELGQITIDGLEINGEIDRNDDNNWDSYGNYIQTVIYNETDTQHSLLHRLISFAPHWKLGSIAKTITVNGEEKTTSTEHRTFNFDGTNVYDALQEIATELDVVFVFNTVTRSINMYDLNKVGEDTTIHVSTKNLAEDFTCTSNKDSIKNCFKIVGGDNNINEAIRAVNPNGTNYSFYISEDQMEDMSYELSTRITEYQEYFDSSKDGYNTCCENLYNAIDNQYYLEISMMPKRTPPTTSSELEIAKLTSSKIGSIPVASLKTLYKTGMENAILTIAQVLIDYRYEVSIEEGSSYDTTSHTWTGKFKVTNTADNTDSAISTSDIVLTAIENEKEYLQDKIDEIIGAIDIEDEEDINVFKQKLKKYGLVSLQQFQTCFEECANILLEKGYANQKEANEKTEFYKLYYSYYEKIQACKAEIAIRQEEVDNAKILVEKYTDEVREYQKKLNFVNYLGTDLYKEFCLYRREDVYQNDNYISDGQDNSELLQNAKKLVEVATKELIKASQFQTVYSANLNNLFTNPIYKPFYEHFDLFNWIHAEIDAKQIMLRLIAITFDFSSIEKIEVEFSEQVRNANGITDLESILGQAKSMATSYSSTLKQAQNGQEACLEFDTIKQEGLNSALMNIKNANEETVIDNRGINCRSKDQNDQYDQCQLIITGKNIVLTKDDFETASMAIGAGLYKGQEVYGVWGDLICGDILIGKELNILNSNSTLTMDENGLTITNGVNTIVFDPNNTELMNVTNNDKKIFYLNELGDLFIDGNIFGGSLHLENDLGTYVDINPDKENIMEIGGIIEPTKVEKLDVNITSITENSIAILSNKSVSIMCNDENINTIDANIEYTIDNLTSNTNYKLIFTAEEEMQIIYTRTKMIVEFSFTGEEFNAAIKTLVNESETAWNIVDNTVEAILFSENPPTDDDINKVLAQNIDGGQFVIYIEENDRTKIKMYCNTSKIKLSNNMNSMFNNFTALKSLDLSNFDTSNVIDMNSMFSNCYNLTSLDLSNFDTSNVRNMIAVFSNCYNLTSLDLSNFDTSNVRNMSWMFLSCHSLKSLDLSSFDTSNVIDMSHMIQNCVTLPIVDISSFDTTKVTDMNHMFCGSRALSTIYVGDKWRITSGDASYMFYDCGTSTVTYK